MAWRLARSLATLDREVHSRWPDAPRSGTIGDAAHAARPSDHNPGGPGDVVTALDVMGLPQAKAVWDHIVATRPARVEYAIHDGRKTGSDLGWAVVRYTGSNPHATHCHVSVGRGSDGNPTRPDLYDDPSPWGIAAATPTDPGEPTMFLGYTFENGNKTDLGELLQRCIRDIDAKALPVDGIDGMAGANTARAFGRIVQPDHPEKYTTGYTITPWAARRFAIFWQRAVAGPGALGYSQAQADTRFARKAHTHKVTGAAK